MAKGLEALDSLIRRVEVVLQVVQDNTLISDIVARNESRIVALNTEDQLEKRGVNSLGISISSYAPYAPKTVYLKRKKGQPWDRVTLRDTGRFHSTFQLKIDQSGFSIISDDKLSAELSSKYGPQIFGLTPENVGNLAKSIILPELLEEINKRLLL